MNEIQEVADHELRQAITNYINTTIPEDMTITPTALNQIITLTQIYTQTLTKELLSLDKYNVPIGAPFKEHGNKIIEDYVDVTLSNSVFGRKSRIEKQTKKIFNSR